MRAVELSALHTLTKERRFVSVKDHTKQGTKHMKQQRATVFAASNGNVVQIFTERPEFEKRDMMIRGYFVRWTVPVGDVKSVVTKSEFYRVTGENVHIGEVKEIRLVLGATKRTKGGKFTLSSDYWNGAEILNKKGKAITNFCTTGFVDATGFSVYQNPEERTLYPIAVQIV